jgi:hypothetical protein
MAYMFHGVGEEINTLAVLEAQLRSQIINSTNPK